jgi:hypothetical protein
LFQVDVTVTVGSALWGRRRVWSTGNAGVGGLAPGFEQAGFAVFLGFDLVVGPAARLEVLIASRPVVGDWVNVIELQSVAFTAVGAFLAVELGRIADIESGTQIGGYVPAEPGEGEDVHAIVQHDVEEGVLGELFGNVYRDGAAVDDVARLTFVDMTAPPG